MKSKYHNKKVIYQGIKFDSKKERDWYIVLKTYEKNGKIKELKRQVAYELIPTYKINNKTIRKTQYIADFAYITTNDNKLHIVDIKGSKNTITEAFKIKKKLFEYRYGVEIEIII
jgi:hypothetical protein